MRESGRPISYVHRDLHRGARGRSTETDQVGNLYFSIQFRMYTLLYSRSGQFWRSNFKLLHHHPVPVNVHRVSMYNEFGGPCATVRESRQQVLVINQFICTYFNLKPRIIRAERGRTRIINLMSYPAFSRICRFSRPVLFVHLRYEK